MKLPRPLETVNKTGTGPRGTHTRNRLYIVALNAEVTPLESLRLVLVDWFRRY